MAFAKLKVGNDIITVSTYNPRTPLSLLKCAYVLHRIIESFGREAIAEEDFHAWLKSQPGGCQVLDRVVKGEIAPAPEQSVDPLNAAEEARILSWIVNERHSQTTLGPFARPARPAPAQPGKPAADQAPAVKPRRSIWAKARSFLRAVGGPKVSPEIFAERMRLCSANTCGHLKVVGDNKFCTACGCPNWRLAELGRKLWYARLECPLEQPLWKAVEPVPNGDER